MRKVFISYTRNDLNRAQELEQALSAHGVGVWRDQHSLYGGELWPKKLGEAIADCEAVLLLWSAQSAKSHFVEFEWTTALALKKTVIPLLLDETTLPPALAAINGVFFQPLDEATLKVLAALPTAPQPHEAEQHAQVIAQLASIPAAQPAAETLKQAQAMFTQSNITVGGHFIQGGGDVQVTIHESRPYLSLLAVALAVVVLTVSTWLYYSTRPKPDPVKPLPAPPPAMKVLVNDAQGNPVAGAVVELDALPGKQFITKSDGAISIENIPRKPGDLIGFKISKGNAKADGNLTFPNPRSEVITLR